MKLIRLSLTAGVLLAGLSGCGMGPTLTPAQMQKVKTFDVSQITTLGDEIHKGMNQDELLFYAPINISKAKEDYENALTSEDKEEKLASYLSAKKDLANAYETKKLVKKYLSDIASVDKKMKALDTQEIFASRYNDFKDGYNDLIRTFDEGKVSDALEDKKAVMASAKDLYGDAVVYRNINEAKIIMQKMSDEDLDESVPKHYEKLEKLYEQTYLKIKREPDNREMVKKVAKKLNEFAHYTETLAKDVVKLKSIDSDDYERYLDRIHHEVASLNKNEKMKSILALSIEDKINYLKEHKNQISVQTKSNKVGGEVPLDEEKSSTVVTSAIVPVVEEVTPKKEATPSAKSPTSQKSSAVTPVENSVPQQVQEESVKATTTDLSEAVQK